jgi:hypothetical protein
VTPPTTAHQHRFTVDTGSIGTAVSIADLGPDAIGPGGPAMKYYDSSGKEFIGYLYLAPVAINAGGTWLTTAPIRVLGVVQASCNPKKAGCKPQTTPFHYLGVGFDRGGTEAEGPFTSPADNALLQVQAPSGQSITPGYVLSGSTLQVGLTSTNGFQTESLTSSSTVPGDFNTAEGCVALPPVTTTEVCGTILLDVGVPEMFLTVKPGALVSGSLPLKSNQVIDISFGSMPAIATYSFSAGAVPGGKSPIAVGEAPSKVEASYTHQSTAPPVFINTGRHVLFGYSYLFDAAHGLIGLQPLTSPLR